uniref:C2H2-type domain-containing protein n=1 Tax=Salix viminalis TaxID=40686 RepID=A0A6N2M8F7_SALVM
MDSQDPRKNPSLTPGHESHGVYVCNKCGWPFPNPHPSARHRRAHKKICGTLKGYKFVDSEETPLSALSDDDRGSDEDPKTPSPKGLGRGINEKGSGGVGSRSNRSEDDVFTDAIAEFPESGSSSVTGEHTKDVKEPEINLEVNKAAAQSSEDGSITVISPPPSNSADHIHMQSTEVPVINLSESPQESLDHDLNATIASMSRTLTDFRGEQSGFEHSHDNRSSARDPIPIELETQTDASQEKKSVTVEDLPKTDAKGNEETKSEGQLLDVVDSTNDNAKDVSEVASKSQKMEDVTSQPVPAAEVPQLKEGGYTDDLASGMSLNDHYPEVKSVEPAHSSISTAQIKGDAPQEIDSAVYANSTVTYDNKGEGNENVHVLVVPNDLTVVSDAENMVKGFKDLEGGKLPKLMNVDSFDVFNNVKDSDLKDNPQVLNSRSLTEDTETSASDMHVLIDNLEPKDGTSQHIVEEFLDEAEADVPQISEVSVADVVTGDLEKSISVHSPEENVPRDHCDTSSLTSSIEHATKVIPDTNTVVVPSDAEVRQTKLVGMDGTGNDEKDKIESSEIGVKDIFAENTIPSFKHVSIPSEQADQRNSLLGDVKATGLEEGKRERCNVSEIVTEGDSVSGLGEENLLREPNSTLESAVNVESRFTSENEINVCEANLPQHASIPSEQADQRNRLHGDVKAAGDSLSGLGEENLLRKTKTIPESAVNVESRFTSENEINVCEANLPQHASIPSDQADQRNRLHGDVIAAGLEEGKIERCNVSEIVTEGDSVSGLGEENLLRNPKTTPESAVNVESRFTSENEINVCEVKLPHHEHTDIGRVLDPQESRKEPESNGMANQQAEHAGEDSTAAESDSGGGDVEVLRKSSEEKMVREPLVSPSEPSSTLQNSSPVAHNQARDFPGVASGNTPESLPDEGVNYFATQQVVASATDFSADSISQTDSLEGHWGSVSVLSTQSDIPAILDAEPLPSNGSRASEAEEATLKKPIAASETEHADKSDIFDPPSVTALIEPRDVVNQKAAASEIQTTWNPQQPKAASVQAGLSPSITDVSNEWQGRKKHEEIMAKVTDWSTGKQHTPLKNLLGEASMETRFKSLNAKEIPVEKDGPAAKDNGSLPKTVSSILAPQEPEGEPAKLEEKAWSSPARYPADIKREKRRVRGRPYWAQFVCCSSVN